MIATQDVTPFMSFVRDLGGWGALVLFVAGSMYLAWRGGSAFMALAREFSASVIENLEGIREEVGKHNERLMDLDERLERVDSRLGTLTEDVRRHSMEIGNVCKGHQP